MSFNSKGNAVLDMLIVFVVIFILAMGWLTIGYIQKELNTDIQNDPELRAENKAVSQDITNRYPNMFDGAIVMILILFWGMALLAAGLQETHPAFFWFSLILLILTFSVLIALSNTFYEVFNTELTGLTDSYPMTFFIFNHLLEIGIIVGMSILLVLFAKPR